MSASPTVVVEPTPGASFLADLVVEFAEAEAAAERHTCDHPGGWDVLSSEAWAEWGRICDRRNRVATMLATVGDEIKRARTQYQRTQAADIF